MTKYHNTYKSRLKESNIEIKLIPSSLVLLVQLARRDKFYLLGGVSIHGLLGGSFYDSIRTRRQLYNSYLYKLYRQTPFKGKINV